MKKTLLITLSIIAFAILIWFGLRFLSGDEDTWLCVNGQWVKHGQPTAPSPTTPCKPVEPPVDTPENFTIAFIGDQGYGKNAQAVLQLINNEGADMVLHQGDFDYLDDPEKWDNQISGILGTSFPYFASVGNHELKAWSGYQQKLLERLDRVDGANCQGDLGVNSACTYQGIFFVLSGVGTLGKNHFPYLNEQLAASDATWKICSWHKNQQFMQVGGKSDEVGWAAYDACRQYGAIIVTGHEHSYSRTYLMDSFASQTIANTSSTLELERGKTFAVVSGIAGYGIRTQKDELAEKPWWAAVYTKDQNANYGALFCIFNVNGEENKANCYFKDIDGNIPDRFYLISK